MTGRLEGAWAFQGCRGSVPWLSVALSLPTCLSSLGSGILHQRPWRVDNQDFIAQQEMAPVWKEEKRKEALGTWAWTPRKRCEHIPQLHVLPPEGAPPTSLPSTSRAPPSACRAPEAPLPVGLSCLLALRSPGLRDGRAHAPSERVQMPRGFAPQLPDRSLVLGVPTERSGAERSL